MMRTGVNGQSAEATISGVGVFRRAHFECVKKMEGIEEVRCMAFYQPLGDPCTTNLNLDLDCEYDC
jgi:hypothetical protein